jgi:hypothetical protein
MDFDISIISVILCILMFLIITFIKKFKNITMVPFLEIFCSRTQIWNMIWNFSWEFFKNLVLKYLLLLLFNKLSKYNLIMNFKVKAIDFQKGNLY